MAEQQRQNNLFSTLRRLFSTDVIIRNEGGDMLKVVDTDTIQRSGVIQTNSLVDRFNKVYTMSTAYGVNLNLSSIVLYFLFIYKCRSLSFKRIEMISSLIALV